jgi:anhydro-N-acetylmuramic acid kinase
MSGTSADGIDAVVASISGSANTFHAELLAHVHRPFHQAFRQEILRVALHGTVSEICELNFLLGEHFSKAALLAISKAKLKPKQIAAVGSHGQTIHHLPYARTPSTLQIGEPCIIAERTGITTVADFRVRDMAAGGQGAPLVPFADWALFRDKKRPRIIQNIGGIANLTFLPPKARIEEVIAFDTGPGNMVMDALVSKLSHGRQTMDLDGLWAAKGNVSEPLLSKLMTHPFLRRPAPKTTGREEFGEHFVNGVLASARKLRLRKEDIVATATAFTVQSIAEAYRRFVFPRIQRSELASLQIIIGGGGSKNKTLRRMLKDLIGFGELLTHKNLGVPNEAKEALAFALLAHETLAGHPSNVPSATGARRPVVLGKIIPAG